MTENYPVTPPDELVEQWNEEWYRSKVKHVGVNEYIATQAARWGDDQRLEACRDWVADHISALEAAELCVAMRPKPPSLAEKALDAAKKMSDCMNNGFVPKRSSLDIIRRALERLQQLEQENNDN